MAKRWWHMTGEGWDSVTADPAGFGCPSSEIVHEVQLAPINAVVCERGSREWAVVMAMRGIEVAHSDDREAGERSRPHAASSIIHHTNESGWYELPAPWTPKKGERVRWHLNGESGTGLMDEYDPLSKDWPYIVRLGRLALCVERVEPLEPSHG